MKNHTTYIRLLSVFLVSLLLSACGGGGGGGGGTLTAPSLSFTDAGPVTKYTLDTSYSNPATSNSSGAISYSSSDNSVASVDNNGTVTIGSAGSATISATIAASGSFDTASASYSLVISDSVTFSAWIGATNSEVVLPASTSSYTFYSSTDRTCNPLTASQCLFNQPLMNGTTFSEDQAKLGAVAYYWLTNGQQSSASAVVSESRFSARRDHQVAVFNNKLWLVAGEASGIQKDVWSSTDGKIWDQANSTAFNTTAKTGHQIVSFTPSGSTSPRLWLIGGGNGALAPTNEIYTSVDGSSWQQSTCATPCFNARHFHQTVVYQNKIWLIGGQTFNSTALKDVWTSTNGTTWTQGSDGGFSARWGHQAAVFQDKLWLIGGYDNASYKNDIWSFDGSSWTEVSASATFPARSGHQLIAFNNKLWLIGGNNSSTLADVWNSDDGSTWTQVTAAAEFGALSGHKAAVFNDKLWITGGNNGSSNSDKVWSSADGITWKLEDGQADFSKRNSFALESFNNKLWVIAGSGISASAEDVWSSSDGIRWDEESASAAFKTRTGHASAVFNNKLWLSGGQTVAGTSNEIWSSADGKTWDAVGAPSGLALTGHQMLAFNSELWIIGGFTSSPSNLNYSSADGVTWTKRSGTGTSNAQVYTARDNHQVVVHNGKLWLSGGADSSTKNDTWVSTDGLNWDTDQNAVTNAFSARSHHQMVVFNGAMWIIGGKSGVAESSAMNDVWKYVDGTGWQQINANTNLANAHTTFSKRHSHRVVAHSDGKLYLIGGIDKDGNKLHDVWSSSDGSTWRRAFSSDILLP